MAWHQTVILKLRASGLFQEVRMVGAKMRASISAASFVDIHFDPTTGSYSYALIDLTLPFPGDKRVFGWDDYAHEGVVELERLPTFPHHFQRRDADGRWLFEPSPMRGQVGVEIDVVITTVREYLQTHGY
jgi:hypothetical protein